MKRREEEAKRLDEEQPEVSKRLEEMKDKARVAAQLRFERDKVSCHEMSEPFGRPGTRMSIRSQTRRRRQTSRPT